MYSFLHGRRKLSLFPVELYVSIKALTFDKLSQLYITDLPQGALPSIQRRKTLQKTLDRHAVDVLVTLQ